MKAAEFAGDLSDFLNRYEYQPSLTGRLDNIGNSEFTQRTIDEIVLWKLNRYVAAGAELLSELNALTKLSPGEHRRGEETLRLLLETHGADLAMASTVLRFRNPAVFQIIDRHAYRALCGKDYSLHAGSPANRKVVAYFDYIDNLRELCKAKALHFQDIDRLLYIFDKETNGKL